MSPATAAEDRPLTLLRRAPEWLIGASEWVWRSVVVGVGVLLVVYVLSHLLVVALPVIVALLLSTVLVPVVRWLEHRGLPPALAALLALLGFVALVAGAVGLLVPQVAGQVGEVRDSVAEGLQTVRQFAGRSLGVSQAEVEQAIEQAPERLQDQASSIGTGVLSGAVLLVEFVTGVLLTLVLLFFFLKDRHQLNAWFLARTPTRRRDGLRAVSERVWRTVAGYVRGQAIIAVVDGVGIGLGLLLIGVPLVIPLAVLVFLGAFVPIVGAFVAGTVAVLVALVSNGLGDALLVLAVILGVQQLEGHVLQPVVLGHALPLHPVVVLLAIAAGTVLGGVVGAFLAVPVAGVISAIGNELRLRREAAVDTEERLPALSS